MLYEVYSLLLVSISQKLVSFVEVTSFVTLSHAGQCKSTGCCYNELVIANFHTGAGVNGKKIYTCRIHDLFISLHIFYL